MGTKRKLCEFYNLKNNLMTFNYSLEKPKSSVI